MAAVPSGPIAHHMLAVMSSAVSSTIAVVGSDLPSFKVKIDSLLSKLGLKTGRGFYDYENESIEEILRKRDRYFVRQWKLIQDLQRD